MRERRDERIIACTVRAVHLSLLRWQRATSGADREEATGTVHPRNRPSITVIAAGTEGKGWSDEEVVRRWGRLSAPRDKSRQPLPVSCLAVESARTRIPRTRCNYT